MKLIAPFTIIEGRGKTQNTHSAGSVVVITDSEEVERLIRLGAKPAPSAAAAAAGTAPQTTAAVTKTAATKATKGKAKKSTAPAATTPQPETLAADTSAADQSAQTGDAGSAGEVASSNPSIVE